MSLFWEHVFSSVLLQYAVIGAVLASVACGVIGSYVVVRRSTYVAGAIAHCCLGGMGAARYLQVVYGLSWFTPLVGAVIAAVLAALLIALVTANGKQRADTVLSAVWAIGMAAGLSFINATPGYEVDLMSYLFGNILMIQQQALWQMAVLDVLILGFVLLLYNKMLVVSFQPELAKLRGIRVGVYQTLLLILIALSVVLLTQVVGLVMAIALLTLPAATASLCTSKLSRVMMIAVCFSLFCTLGGIAASYEAELHTGATVVECAGGLYLLVLGARRLLRAIRARCDRSGAR
jgi:zinc transport system permease protein